MNTEQLKDILDKAGYHLASSCPSDSVCIVDPTCIWPILRDFISFAWVVITLITAFLFAGWAATMLRGAKNAITKNLRDLMLIFGLLSAALPIINVLGGGKFMVDQCRTVRVTQEQINELVGDRKIEQPEYEYFNITDSAYTEEAEDNF